MFITLSTVFVLVALAAPVNAQIKIGVQGALLTDLDDLVGQEGTYGAGARANGTYGAGARAALQPPIFPLGLVAQGVYYFPDVDDTSYSTYSLAAQLRFPLPFISPYVIGGWQWRRSSPAGATSSTTENGIMVGVGVQLTFGLFVEATMELNDDLSGALSTLDTDPIVIKAGIILGG